MTGTPTLTAGGAFGYYDKGIVTSRCGDFSNTSAYCHIPLSNIGMVNIKTLSFSGWYKVPSLTDFRHLFEFWSDSSNRFLIEILADGQLRSWNGSLSTVCNDTIKPNTWFHFAMTVDSGVASFYINGKRQSNTTEFAGYTTRLYIGTGGTDTSAYNLMGYVNDIRIYNHALTKKEVQLLSRGLICHYTFDQHLNLFNMQEYLHSPTNNCGLTRYGLNGLTMHSTGTDPYTTNYWWTLNTYDGVGSIKFPVQEGWTYCVSWQHVSGKEFNKNFYSFFTEDNKNVGPSAFFGMSMESDNKWRYHLITIPTGYGITKISIRLGSESLASGQTTTISDVMLTTYQGPDFYAYGGVNKLPDEAGNDHSLQRHGVPAFTTDSPRYSKCIDFHNTGFYENNNFNMYTDNFTLSYWIKMPVRTNAQHFIYGTHDNWTHNGVDSWRDQDGSAYAFLFRSSAESSHCGGTISISANEWHHIACTYNGNNVVLYRDGEVMQTSSYGKNGAVYHPVMYLGNSLYGGAPASEIDEAQLSDFRMYATAFSQEQVQELYHIRWEANRQNQVFVASLKEDADRYNTNHAGAMHCHSLTEDDDIISISKHGEVSCNEIYEI
jgi:hypothetical protein